MPMVCRRRYAPFSLMLVVLVTIATIMLFSGWLMSAAIIAAIAVMLFLCKAVWWIFKQPQAPPSEEICTTQRHES